MAFWNTVYPYKEFTFTARHVDALMESGDIVDNVMAAFYAGHDRTPYADILGRIADVRDEERRTSLLSRFAAIVSWRQHTLPPEVVDKLEEMTMVDITKVEGNPYLEPIAKAYAEKKVAEGEIRGEMRGRLIAKAEIFGAPPTVEEIVRAWPIDDLSSLEELIETARESGNWSFDVVHPRNGR